MVGLLVCLFICLVGYMWFVVVLLYCVLCVVCSFVCVCSLIMFLILLVPLLTVRVLLLCVVFPVQWRTAHKTNWLRSHSFLRS